MLAEKIENQRVRSTVTCFHGIFAAVPRIAIAFTVVTLLAGCEDPNRAKIVGNWEIQSAEDLTDRLIDSESQPEKSSKSPMRLEFYSRGTMKTSTAMGAIQQEKNGTWELVSMNEPKTQAVVKIAIGLQTTEHEIDFQDDDTMEMVPPNLAGLDMKVQFRRAK